MLCLNTYVLYPCLMHFYCLADYVAECKEDQKSLSTCKFKEQWPFKHQNETITLDNKKFRCLRGYTYVTAILIKD